MPAACDREMTAADAAARESTPGRSQNPGVLRHNRVTIFVRRHRLGCTKMRTSLIEYEVNHCTVLGQVNAVPAGGLSRGDRGPISYLHDKRGVAR